MQKDIIHISCSNVFLIVRKFAPATECYNRVCSDLTKSHMSVTAFVLKIPLNNLMKRPLYVFIRTDLFQYGVILHFYQQNLFNTIVL